jgi:hypothetical protein
LVVATTESNTDSDSAEEAVIRAREILSNATTRGAEVVVATILNVASDMVRSVDAITSGRVAGVIGTTNAVTAGFLGGLASTSLVVASGRPAAVSGSAWDGIMDAHTVGARVNSASISVIAIHFRGLATKNRVADGRVTRTGVRAVGVHRLAMKITNSTDTVALHTSSVSVAASKGATSRTRQAIGKGGDGINYPTSSGRIANVPRARSGSSRTSPVNWSGEATSIIVACPSSASVAGGALDTARDNVVIFARLNNALIN